MAGCTVHFVNEKLDSGKIIIDPHNAEYNFKTDFKVIFFFFEQMKH